MAENIIGSKTMPSQSNTQKALKGMSSQALVTLVLGLVEIVSFSIMSRLLSQEDFGYYAALTAITTVFASFSETGMGASIIQRKDITDRFVNNAFTISCIVGLFVASLLLIFSKPLSAGLVDESMLIPLMLMSITLLFHNVTSVNISIMHRRLQFLKVGAINLVSLLITSIIAIFLAYYGFGYYAILTKALLTSVITFVLTFWGAKTRYKFQLDKETFKSIFGFSGWLMASVFFRNLAQQMDRLLMSRLLSVNALGAYNRPKEFINHISSKLNSIFDTALFPVLSGIQDDLTKVRSAYLRSFYYMNIFAIVLSTAFIFNSELIIRIFLGEKWLSVLTTMQILSCVLVFNIDARLADCYLRSMGWTKQQFYFRILEVALKISGLIICVQWGINGVALAVVIVNAITIWIKNIYVSKRIELSLVNSFMTILRAWKIGYVIIPFMIVCTYVLPDTIWGNIINLTVYGAIVLVGFIFVPSLVGEQYKGDAYQIVIKKVKSKIHIK